MARNPYDLPILTVGFASAAVLLTSLGVWRQEWWLVRLGVVPAALGCACGAGLLHWLRSLDRSLVECGRGGEIERVPAPVLPGIRQLLQVIDRLRRKLGIHQGTVQDIRGRVRGKGRTLRSAAEATQDFLATRGELVKEQLHAVKRVSGAWDQINDMSLRIANQAEEVERASSQVSSTGEEGARASVEAVDEMDRVRNAVVDIAEKMRNLRSSSEKVGETARAIDQVSTQINLLALNAAIEAAGAGEFGERFGVVAVEVKRLADQTVVATRMIKELLSDIQSEVTEGIELTERGALSVQKGYSRVQQLEQVLTSLNNTITIADRNAKNILGSTKVQVFAVRNARKEVEGIERALVGQGAPEDDLASAAMGLRRLAEELDEVEGQVA